VLVAAPVLYVVGERNPTGVRFAEEPNSGLSLFWTVVDDAFGRLEATRRLS
jgi:hypothetical protein